MPAAIEKSRLEPVRKLGIIAGGGSLPERLVGACEAKGIEPFVVAFEGQTNPETVRGKSHMWARLGAAGHVLKTLHSHEISDLVLIGSIRRPSFFDLRPDLKTAEFFARIGLKALGDNDLLGILRGLLEEEGFRLHGVHKFAEDLLAGKGVLGKHKPKKGDMADINRGLEVSRTLGLLDVGQAVIVQEGMVLGVEAAEGTDELLQRCKHLKRRGRGGVLVKTCKPQQDMDFDLPTVGPQTIRNAHSIGLAGVVVHAGHSLLIDVEDMVTLADRNKMFIIGVNPDEMLRG
jgi:DUF1009 family protein